MKNVPNIITILRILFSIILLSIKPLTPLFLLVYFICGLSDILDGYIARRTSSTSNLGSTLDSIADIVFMGTVIITLLPVIRISREILIWIIFIALFRMASLFIIYFKYKTFAILHTYGNKATGFSLFCCPYLFMFFNVSTLGYLVCIIASLSAVEELLINVRSKELLRNISWIFEKK